MNAQLKRMSLLVLVMFLVLLGASTTIQMIRADALAADDRNARTRYDAYKVERGSILIGGEAVAYSMPSNDDFAFQRTYTDAEMNAAVTGYFPVLGVATGLEGAMNTYLSGTANTQFFDRVVEIVSGQDPKGATVETSIDPVGQRAAWEALQGYQGAVILSEPSTGRILAMVSTPSFDTNLLAVHSTSAVDLTYQQLLSDPTQPLYNRAIGGNLNPPGSVFKLVVTATALESGRYTPESEFPNPARYTLPGTSTQIENTNGKPCGTGATVTLATALRLSCNIPFAELGVELGDAAIRDQAEKFGFNDTFEIPTLATASVYPRVLDEAQTALSAFGQYEVRATPLQMVLVSSAIANGGKVMQPNLVQAIISPNLSPISTFTAREYSQAISAETAATMTRMMVDGVSNGAASNAKISGVEVAGKTGTAQNGTDDPHTLWFTGFAPANDPQYAITVLVENGGGLGQDGFGNLVAAPIAKKVLEAVLNK